jgi:hypothetical protein
MVMIVQLLCPARHCILAAAYEQPVENYQATVAAMQKKIKELGIRDHCGICGSHKLEFEERATGFATIKEAMPHLLKSQLDNAVTRAYLESRGWTYDSAAGSN